jgi:hypothetical protein
VIVGACSREYLEAGVAGSKFLEPVANLLLGERIRELILPLVNETGRHVGIEVVQGPHPYTVKHLPDIFLSMRKIRETTHIIR